MKLSLKKICENKVTVILFAFVVSFVVCSGLLSDSIYAGYDLTFHMNRLVGIKEAFQDRQFMPKIYPYTNNGYGYASPLFYCDLFLYPFAVLYYIGIPLVVAYKTMIFSYVFLTCIIVFTVTRKVTESQYCPFVSVIAYVSCSYYIFNIYARAAIGEVFAFCFIPLVIYEIYRLIIKKENNFIWLGIGFALLLESHLISFVMYCFFFFVCLVVFMINNRKDKESMIGCFKTVLKAIVIALLLSAWYLFPMCEQLMSQTFWVNELGKIYDASKTVQNIKSLFVPFISVDSITDNFGENGIFTILGIGVLIPTLSLLYIKEKKNKYINALVITIVIVSLFLYGVLPLPSSLNFIQFLYRLNLLIMPLEMIVLIYCIDKQPDAFKKVILIISTFYLLANVTAMNNSTADSDRKINNDATREFIYDDSNISKDYNDIEISGAEYLPVTLYTNYLAESDSIKEYTNDSHTDLTYDYEKSFTRITFTYTSDERKLIMLPQTYYLGYKAYEVSEDGNKEVEVITTEKYKQVSFYIEEGTHTYTCKYEGTTIQKTALVISIISTLSVIYILVKNRKKLT